MNKAVVTEVLSWGELWGNISPYYLPYLLGQMKGVSQGTHADRFNNLVFYAEDRDSLLFVSPITTTPSTRSLLTRYGASDIDRCDERPVSYNVII